MNGIAKLQEGAELTDRQRAFVDSLLSGGSNTEALAAAGYSETVPAAQVLRSASVQAALRAGRRAIVRGELGGVAIEAMRDLLSPATPAATRFQAAKWVLEQGEDQAADGDKPLSEMTEAELMGVIERAQLAVQGAKLGPIVDITPGNPALS